MRLCRFIGQLCTNTLSPKRKRSNHDVRVADEVYFAENRCKKAISKQAMRDETERLVKEVLERKTLTVKQVLNSVSAAQGQVRVPYMCKECGEKQRTF